MKTETNYIEGFIVLVVNPCSTDALVTDHIVNKMG